jgi:hypothetical protein
MKVTSETGRVSTLLRDTAVVELALPAYMMAYMVEEAQKKGFILRADVIAHLGRAAVLPLTRIAEASVSLMARKITDAAATILRELNPDDPRHGLYCLAMFVLMLVDEELFSDPRNQAVLVALLLLDDVKNDKARRQRGNAGVDGQRNPVEDRGQEDAAPRQPDGSLPEGRAAGTCTSLGQSCIRLHFFLYKKELCVIVLLAIKTMEGSGGREDFPVFGQAV